MCDGTQIVKRYRYRYFYPVPNIFDTDTGTFFGTKFFRYRFRDFVPTPNFTDTGSETFFRYQIFPIPVPIPPEKWQIHGTDTNTVPVPIMNLLNSKMLATKFSSGTNFFRYRFRDFFPVPNLSDTGSKIFFRYQIFPIPVRRLFLVPIFYDTGSDSTNKMTNSRYGYDTLYST